MNLRRPFCRGLFLLAAGFFSSVLQCPAAAPVVSNVRSAQRAGTQLVDVDYDVADADSPTLTVAIAVSTNGGASYTLPATSFTGALGVSVTPGANKRITWNAGVDWPNKFSANVRFRVTADDSTAPSGMALIPAGSFTMGNCMAANEGNTNELPLHTVYVSAFYMDKFLVTKALWNEVRQWATNHGYSFSSGSGKAANHPVHTITWYDAVKWCNARSEKEGRVAAYYTNAAQTTAYRSGQVNVDNAWVKWNTGYRLPTEAEWEKAARGGASGHRFPWSNVDTISHSQANYPANTNNFAYDVSPTPGYHPTFATGGTPHTSPVGYFAPNGYGLYDMAGNVLEWCWDLYSSTYYSASPGSDPRGAASGSYRMLRGGGWCSDAFGCRTAYRVNNGLPGSPLDCFGFRSVLPSGQ